MFSRSMLSVIQLLCLCLIPTSAFHNNDKRILNLRTQHKLHNVIIMRKATQINDNIESQKNAASIKTNYVVCGGGPAGLLASLMLAQKYPGKEIQMYDRLSTPPSPSDDEIWNDVAKFYLIGLGSRGQKALNQFGVLDEVKKYSVNVVGRKDWAPDADEGVERIFDDRAVTTICLPRDKLVAVLHQYIVQNYSNQIQLNYGYEIQPIQLDATGDDPVVVQAVQCAPDNTDKTNLNNQRSVEEIADDVLCDTDKFKLIECDLLIAADGAQRTIANAIQEADAKRFKSKNPVQRLLSGQPFQVVRYEDDNRRVYKTVPMKLPTDWRTDINYSARTKGSRVVFDALPANDKGNYCGVLLLRDDDPLAQPNSSPNELRKLLDESLPDFSAIIDDQTCQEVAAKKASFLPNFRYAGPRLHEGDKTIILGDCAHTVKPYFGMG